MSENTEVELKQNKENNPKRRRRQENGKEIKRKPIRLVSSLGEGKLLDRFQNAINEKESKKKIRERGDKERKYSKEKREREMAKFKAELDALLEDDTPPSQPVAKPKEKKIYVPKLSGTVKGKFEALEQKKKEEEKNKISNEKQKRLNRDFIEKKRIQIELAQKKQQDLLNDEKDSNPVMKRKKKPGKLQNNFEDRDKQRLEKEKKKIEFEKKLKLSTEIQAVKEYYSHHQEEAKLFGNREGGSESSSENGNSEKQRNRPKRLSTSFTKFDVLEKERKEEERKRIQERRKALLEEEKKLFEEAKRQQDQQSADEEEYCSESQKKKLPGSLKSSLVNFDTLARQRLEEDRKRIQEERAKLLEEEKKHFLGQKLTVSDESATDSDASDSNESDCSENKKGKTRRKNISRTPSKLARSRLKFDVLEKERMENRRVDIQKQRQALLEEEKKLFEQARTEEDRESSDSDQKDENVISPGRLDSRRTKFDVVTIQRMDDERERIKRERNRLLDEEKRLMDEEKKKIQEMEENEKLHENKSISHKKQRKPNRLDKSFTTFDILERQRIKAEEEKMYKEKAAKLKQEKEKFEEEKKRLLIMTDETDEDSDEEVDESKSNKPKKLSSKFVNFDVLERERIENERLQSQQEKIKKLEQELEFFQEQKKTIDQESDDDITSNTKQMMKLSKNAPRPKRLAASFTQFDVLERKRRAEERELLQKKKAHQLAEERKHFEQSWQQLEDSKDDELISTPCKKKDDQSSFVRKMNVREKMEAVLKAQEESERKRIEETKFERMTVEQQEIYLAKQRQIEFLKEQLARVELASSDDDEDSSNDSDYSDEENDDDNYFYRYSDDEESDGDDENEENDSSESGSNGRDEEDAEDTSMCSGSTTSSGSYSGAPYFVQTLKNLTVTEGDPVRFDANINANPHPKVTWFFKNRLIRNSPDYQYIIKGTQYSLYMNESFLDDVGEYMCKAVNDKGTATSKAYLHVKEAA